MTKTEAGDPVEPDRADGALLGVAVGDMLGLPNECHADVQVRVEDFDADRAGISDDTQLTLVIADALIDGGGEIDGADLAARLVAWRPSAVGIGRATREAVERLAAGVPWQDAGTASAGNGAAMRIAPVGLALADPARRARVCEVATIPTHNDPTAVLSAMALASAVAWLSRRQEPWRPAELIETIAASTAGLPDPPLPRDRRPGAPDVRLLDELAGVVDDLSIDPDGYFARRYSGAYVMESLPAAFWCFLRSPDDPAETIRVAAELARDSDSVAAMAGAMAGAWCGAGRLSQQWISWLPAGLEDRLRHTARQLLDTATH